MPSKRSHGTLVGVLGAVALLAVAGVVMLSGREASFAQAPASSEVCVDVLFSVQSRTRRRLLVCMSLT